MKKICILLALWLLLCCGCSARTPEPVQPSPTQPEPAPVPQAEQAFTPGTVEDDRYENTFLGYGCQLEGWHFYDDDQLAALNASADSTMLVDMGAESDDGMQTLSVQFQKLSEPAEEAALLESIVPTMPDALLAAGYENLKIEQETVSLGGEEHACLSIIGSIQGVAVHQLQVVVSCGEYMAYLSATGYLSDSPYDILRLFYKL